MTQKLIILNNSLRDHRGHYFETSVAIAEAARQAGLRPILATHVDCAPGLFPEWLEVYPLFRTDHWMASPPAPAPDLKDLPTAAPVRRIGVADVRSGAASVREFVHSRYGMLQSAAGAPAPVAAPERTSATVLSACRLAWKSCRSIAWCCDRAMFYFLPQVIDEALRVAARPLKRCLPRILQPEFHPRLESRIIDVVNGHGLRSRLPQQPTPDHNSGLPHDQQWQFEEARRHLTREEIAHELDYALIFKQDLERLLALTDCDRDDHILLGTAHARELLAVHWTVGQLGQTAAPTFHLEYRHPLFVGDPTPQAIPTSPSIRRQQVFFSLYSQWGPSPRIKLYTDTSELSKEHAMLADLDFGVLPIPFRTTMIAPSARAEGDPLTLVYLGDARDEKGFHWLPELIDRLMEDYVRPGKVRFLLQATMGNILYNPKSGEAMDRLQEYPADYVELVGLDGPLGPEAYYRLLSSCDIALLPYDRNRYRASSSGTLAEAIAAGRPSIVPANSWMSAQQPPNSGELFTDQESFIEGVRRLVDHYPRYLRHASAKSGAWKTTHTPAALIAAIAGGHSPINSVQKAA